MKRIFHSIAFLMLAALLTPAFASAPATAGAPSPALKWKRTSINIAISSSLFDSQNIKSDGDISAAVRRSLETWSKVANITFVESASDKQSASPDGPAGDGISLITIAATPENLLLFDGDLTHASARTRVFFDGKGSITEADIVLNPYEQFSTDGSIGTFDLESTITHELGHLLGLDHSMVLGATMHENYAKNGIFNLNAYGPRSLSEDDLSAVRSLYGPRPETESCCGRISGKLLLADGKPAAGFQTWLEESQTGRVIGQVITGADGSYVFRGLPSGNFRQFAQSFAKQGRNSVQDLGIVSPGKEDPKNSTRKLKDVYDAPGIRFVGFNGQLAELAIPVNPGRSYTIYVGAREFDLANVQFGVNSPFFRIDRDSIRLHDYGDGVSAVSFELIVVPGTPEGDYSIFAETGGRRRAIVGAVSVEQFQNPWFTRVISTD